MNLKLDFLHSIIKMYHIECIKSIIAKRSMHDDVKMLLIDKHLNWLKQADNAYNYADTIDKVRELIKKN